MLQGPIGISHRLGKRLSIFNLVEIKYQRCDPIDRFLRGQQMSLNFRGLLSGHVPARRLSRRPYDL